MKSLRISFVCLFLFSVVHCFEVTGQTITVGEPYPVINTGNRFYYSNGTDIVVVKIIQTLVVLQTMKVNDLMQEKRREYNDFPKDYQVIFIFSIHYGQKTRRAFFTGR